MIEAEQLLLGLGEGAVEYDQGPSRPCDSVVAAVVGSSRSNRAQLALGLQPFVRDVQLRHDRVVFFL
jgi:hypothetical protein